MKHFYIMAIVGAIALYSNLKYTYTFAEPAPAVSTESSVFAKTSADYAYDKALSNFITIKEGKKPSFKQDEKERVDPCNDVRVKLMFDTQANSKKYKELQAKYKKFECRDK